MTKLNKMSMVLDKSKTPCPNCGSGSAKDCGHLDFDAIYGGYECTLEEEIECPCGLTYCDNCQSMPCFGDYKGDLNGMCTMCQHKPDCKDIVKEDIMTFTIELNKTEANWLKQIMANPLCILFEEDEDELTKEMRKKINAALDEE